MLHGINVEMTVPSRSVQLYTVNHLLPCSSAIEPAVSNDDADDDGDILYSSCSQMGL